MRRAIFALCILTAAHAFAAPANRISRPIDNSRVHVLSGGVHRLAQPQNDRGEVAASTPLTHITLMVKQTPGQRAELERLLADQQNPSSPQFHKWLTPDEYGARFGLSPSDHSKVAAWLASEGFQVKESARGRNWIAFSGTAGQVALSLHT